MKGLNGVRMILGTAIFLGLPLGVVLGLLFHLLALDILWGVSAGIVVALLTGLFVFVETSRTGSVLFTGELDELAHELRKSNFMPVRTEGSTYHYKYWNFLFEVPVRVEIGENALRVTGPKRLLSRLNAPDK